MSELVGLQRNDECTKTVFLLQCFRYTAKVRLYLPHNFDDRKKYPLLVNVYAGPNSQQVSDRFKLDWGTYLTTTEGNKYVP